MPQLKVIIDEVEYVPKSTIVSQYVKECLRGAFALAWTYGQYPTTEREGNEMLQIYKLLQLANTELNFKDSEK